MAMYRLIHAQSHQHFSHMHNVQKVKKNNKIQNLLSAISNIMQNNMRALQLQNTTDILFLETTVQVISLWKQFS